MLDDTLLTKTMDELGSAFLLVGAFVEMIPEEDLIPRKDQI